jgi:DNA-binding MarR family transcriptional regulator
MPFVASRPRLDLEDYLPYLVNRVGVALAVEFGRDALARRGLSIEMWRVLAVLSSNGEHRQVDLGDMTSIDISTLSRMVTRLARMELVARTRSATSNREVGIRLTAKGRTVVARLIPLAQAYEKAAMDGVAAADLAALKRALRRMHANLAPARKKPRRG